MLDKSPKQKKYTCSALALLLLAYMPAFAAFSQSQTPINIILISWDGVQRNHLYELIHADRLPNLETLFSQGNIVNLTISDHETDTRAGHAEMLTGYPPNITGVYSNIQYAEIPQGYTVFERLESVFGPENIVTMMITGKLFNLEADVGFPFYNARLVLDVCDLNHANASVVGPKMLSNLDIHGTSKFFAFFHFADPDPIGHTFGENSARYEEAIIRLDEWLGSIVSKLKEKNVFEHTIIYVTTDHGFDEGKITHDNAPDIWLATNDPNIFRNGDQMDIAPTILSAFGIDYTMFSPPLPGYMLQTNLQRQLDEMQERVETMEKQLEESKQKIEELEEKATLLTYLLILLVIAIVIAVTVILQSNRKRPHKNARTSANAIIL